VPPQLPSRLHVALYRPAVAGNVGTILRTSVGFGAVVHIVGPHSLDVERDAGVLRAAVGYRSKGDADGAAPRVVVYADVADFARRTGRLFGPEVGGRVVALSKAGKHGAECLSRVRLWQHESDEAAGAVTALCLVLGNESSGLDGVPAAILAGWRGVSVPMSAEQWGGVACRTMPTPLRCYNVAVTAGIALWEAERQWHALQPRLAKWQPQ